jgi:hypothetical protein
LLRGTAKAGSHMSTALDFVTLNLGYKQETSRA